jgi:putative transposase
MVGELDGDLVGIARQPPADPVTDAAIGLGPAGPLSSIAGSYVAASRALAGARATGQHGVVTLEDVLVGAAVAADHEIGDRLVVRFVSEPAAKNPSLVDTVRAYLTNGMAFEATARQLKIHPNTLRYRLDRYALLTGANLNVVEDIVAVWWALVRHAGALGPPA